MIFAMGTGILMAITILIVLARLGLRKFMGYPAVLDATVVLLLGMLLHGTFGGITAAISGGLFFSLMITLIRRYYGYSRFTRRGWVVHEGVLTHNFRWSPECLISKSKQLKPLLLCSAGLLTLLFIL